MPDPAPSAAADIVHAWFADRLRLGALARDTDAYNQVALALPDLIERLSPAAAPPAPAPSPEPPAA